MNRFAIAVVSVSLATATFFPCAAAIAAGGVSTTSSGGVQVIDMDAPAPAPSAQPKKTAHKRAARPATPIAATTLPGAGALLHNALAYVGVPFIMGGTSPSGFDCSGFTQFAFASIGIHVPRTADLQFYGGRPISGDPLPGDLVFFQTYEYGPSHVGLYLGGGQFVNAIGKDVHVESFDSSYFRSRYLGARRYLPG
jgi:cell wall-associated NlpC family hydrolase